MNLAAPSGWIVRIGLLGFILFSAYDIRLYAIRTYGHVIHEFDPWFNYRGKSRLGCCTPHPFITISTPTSSCFVQNFFSALYHAWARSEVIGRD